MPARNCSLNIFAGTTCPKIATHALGGAFGIRRVMHLISLGRLTHIFIQYGYLTVFVGLLAEGAGIPLPGETVLLIASALAARSTGLNIGWIALVAFCTTSAGDNIGFYLGRWGGQEMLERTARKLHLGPG